MDIHEYQAKELLSRYGIAIARGGVAETSQAAEQVAAEIGGSSWVVKAQIHAGDRGKAGGVKVANSIPEVGELAGRMLGTRLVTTQTGAAGKPVNHVYIEEACSVARELYSGMLVDRASGRVTVIASTAGGMDIEQVAAETPEKIFKVAIDPAVGAREEDAAKLAAGLGLEGELADQAVRQGLAVYKAFTELDASLIEINPLVVTNAGELLALDVKMSFDDNALIRHPEIEKLRDSDEEDQDRLERERHGFNYIKLGGDIGCLVTGAGLALATLDTIRLYGGDPANFLDLPPTATRVQVAAAFKRIVADADVKGILVNVVGGGFTRCDAVAEGVTTAVRELGELRVPLVVRFSGANTEVGLMFLKNTGIKFTSADRLGDAVQRVISAVKEST